MLGYKFLDGLWSVGVKVYNVYYYGIVRVGDGEIVVCYFVDD